MELSTRTRGKTRTVIVSGRVGLDQAEELHASLQQVIESAPDRITLDLSSTESVDASVVQLLIAAEASSRARGIHLVLRGDSGVVSAAVGSATGLPLAFGKADTRTTRKERE